MTSQGSYALIQSDQLLPVRFAAEAVRSILTEIGVSQATSLTDGVRDEDGEWEG